MRTLVPVLFLGSLAAAPSQRPLQSDSAQSAPTFKTGTKLVEAGPRKDPEERKTKGDAMKSTLNSLSITPPDSR
jgi:hypothetical protein